MTQDRTIKNRDPTTIRNRDHAHSQERLSLRPDGKVLYRLRRPWPNARGATHLILDPLDFLRRLGALVSFPYSHQVRYHG